MVMNCRQTLGSLGELLDDALSPEGVAGLRAHLARCPKCTEFLASYRAMGRIAGLATTDAWSPDVERRLVTRLRLG